MLDELNNDAVLLTFMITSSVIVWRDGELVIVIAIPLTNQSVLLTSLINQCAVNVQKE